MISRRFIPALLGVAAISAAACGDDGGPTLPPDASAIIVSFGADPAELPAGDWRLRELRLEDDALVLDISHGGGCREHGYWLLVLEDFVEVPDAGPIPLVMIQLHFAHDDDGDPCDALIMPTLSFDLGPLEDAYREEFGAGPAQLILAVPEERDASETRSVTWSLE